jgi:cellulose synthase/poly-beta-1,6-N-acetylglucosamine synthase-like glycosyltransferase
MLGNHERNFAWGGSMAMRKETFDQIGVLEAWKGAVSDDYAVTKSAERAGAKIVFVPECLAMSYGTCSFAELLEFTTRQIIITRVYHPRLWRLAFVAQTIFVAAFIIVPLRSPLLWVAIYALAAAKAWVRLRAVQSVIQDPALSRFGWFYILSSPVVAGLQLYNLIRSALGTDIVWREIRYKLISPHETRVVSGDR